MTLNNFGNKENGTTQVFVISAIYSTIIVTGIVRIIENKAAFLINFLSKKENIKQGPPKKIKVETKKLAFNKKDKKHAKIGYNNKITLISFLFIYKRGIYYI